MLHLRLVTLVFNKGQKGSRMNRKSAVSVVNITKNKCNLHRVVFGAACV
jgi:hypothetical protein